MFAYEQCLLCLGHHPDIWIEAAAYLEHSSRILTEKGVRKDLSILEQDEYLQIHNYRPRLPFYVEFLANFYLFIYLLLSGQLLYKVSKTSNNIFLKFLVCNHGCHMQC